jgi:predicted RecA/RadA family phage recombinase
MDFVAGSAILSGAVVVIGTKVGVALADIASGATGSVQMAGVFEVNKLSTDVVAQGALLYWDTGNSRMTTTVGSNTLAGYAHVAAAAAVTTVQVVLNSMPS